MIIDWEGGDNQAGVGWSGFQQAKAVPHLWTASTGPTWAVKVCGGAVGKQAAEQNHHLNKDLGDHYSLALPTLIRVRKIGATIVS